MPNLTEKYPYSDTIPDALWHDKAYFDKKLSNSQQALMQLTINDPLCKEKVAKSDQTLDMSWLCIILGNKHASTDDLLALKAQLNPCNEVVLLAGASLGNADFIDKALGDTYAKSVFEKKHYRAYIIASSMGHLSLLKHFEAAYTGLIAQMYDEHRYDFFVAASKNGRMDVLKHFATQLTRLRLERIIHSNDSLAYRLAAASGKLAVLEYFEQLFPQTVEEMVTAANNYPYRAARKAGYKDVVEHLRTFDSCKLAVAFLGNELRFFETHFKEQDTSNKKQSPIDISNLHSDASQKI